MLRLNPEQRKMLAETVSGIANIAAGALVFGQFLGAQGFSSRSAALGAVVWAAFVAWSLFLVRRERQL